jgi:lipopolysaccharide exporter
VTASRPDPRAEHGGPNSLSRAELREATLGGLRWVVVARVMGEILTFAGAIALARLIPPSEFGHAAVSLAIAPLAVIVTFECAASFLVQRPDIPPEIRHSAVTLSLGVGLVLSALTFGVAVTLGPPVFGSRTASMVELVSPVFMLAAVGAVPRALLWRALDFRRVSLIEVLGMLAGGVVSVAMAVAGFGAEAIVTGTLAATAAGSAMLFVISPYGLGGFNRSSARAIVGFGLPAALAGLVQVAFNNANYVILAARLTPTAAGLYWRAYQIGVSYQEKLSGVMLRIAYPVYSRTTTLADLRHLHERASRLHATVLLPLLTMLAATAPVLIPWAFGPAWVGSVEPMQILAVAGMIAAILTGYPQVMLAVGRPRELLRFNVIALVLYIGAMLVLVRFGLTVVCLGVVGCQLVVLIAVYKVLLGRHLGIPLSRLVTDTKPAFVGSLALLGVAWPVRVALDDAGAPGIVTLAAAGVTGLAAYALVIRFVFPTAWSDVDMLLRRIVPSGLVRRALRRKDPAAVPVGVS